MQTFANRNDSRPSLQLHRRASTVLKGFTGALPQTEQRGGSDCFCIDSKPTHRSVRSEKMNHSPSCDQCH
jgi:hypothetical protein